MDVMHICSCNCDICFIYIQPPLALFFPLQSPSRGNLMRRGGAIKERQPILSSLTPGGDLASLRGNLSEENGDDTGTDRPSASEDEQQGDSPLKGGSRRTSHRTHVPTWRKKESYGLVSKQKKTLGPRKIKGLCHVMPTVLGSSMCACEENTFAN